MSLEHLVPEIRKSSMNGGNIKKKKGHGSHYVLPMDKSETIWASK